MMEFESPLVNQRKFMVSALINEQFVLKNTKLMTPWITATAIYKRENKKPNHLHSLSLNSESDFFYHANGRVSVILRGKRNKVAFIEM